MQSGDLSWCWRILIRPLSTRRHHPFLSQWLMMRRIRPRTRSSSVQPWKKWRSTFPTSHTRPSPTPHRTCTSRWRHRVCKFQVGQKTNFSIKIGLNRFVRFWFYSGRILVWRFASGWQHSAAEWTAELYWKARIVHRTAGEGIELLSSELNLWCLRKSFY